MEEMSQELREFLSDNSNLLLEHIPVDTWIELSKNRPIEFFPKIIRNNAEMPGSEQIIGLEEVGDTKVVELIAPGAYASPDLSSFALHYVKGLILKDKLGDKLNLPKTGRYVDSALGYGLISHYYIDEFGLSMTEDKPFPDFIVTAIKKFLIEDFSVRMATMPAEELDAINLNDYLNVKASYPRGKNSGLPLNVSGSNRLMNDIAMAINAKLAAVLIKGQSIDQVFSGLAISYVVFSRFQRTAKVVPMNIGGARYDSHFVEPRRRVVNAAPKALAMAVKPLVKWHTVMALKCPALLQDRDNIASRSKGPLVFATDASRFDLRAGGVKLRQSLEVLWDVAKHFYPDMPDTVKDIMFTEAELPTLVTYGFDEFKLYKSSAEALRSGASTTSRAGSVINLMCDMLIEASIMDTDDPNEIVKFYKDHEPTIILGDDLLKVYNATPGGAERKIAYLEKLPILTDVGMLAEQELPTKFLGYSFSNEDVDAGVSGGELVHSTDPLANMFFPERFKNSAIASFVARYVILKEKNAKKVLNKLTNLMRDEEVLKSVYKEFYDDCYEILAQHYSTHPAGRAKVFFDSLPDRDAAAKDIKKSLYKDIDEILMIIAKGSQRDVNFKLIGLPDLDDIVEEDDSSIQSSLVEFVRGGEEFSNAGVTKYIDAKDNKMIRTLTDLTSLFRQNSDMDFVNAFKSILPRVARRVNLGNEEFYSAKL